VVVALVGLHQRHSLLLPPLELMRIGFGLSIPLLLFGHVVSTRIAYSFYGQAAEYQRIVANLSRGGNTGWQLALLAPGWLHGCMGLNLAFRHRAWYQRWRPWLIGAAVALPLFAAAGYWSMIGAVASLPLPAPAPPRAAADALNGLRLELLAGYFAMLAGVLASRSWRDWREWRTRRAR